MILRVAFSLVLIAPFFPLGLYCEDKLPAPTRAEQWQDLPGAEKKAFVVGLIQGFDGAKYFLYLSGRVALTKPTPRLSTRDALQSVEVSFLMPELGKDYSFEEAYSYIIAAIDRKYADRLYAQQSLDAVVRAIIQDAASDRLKD